jgi:hypothetical protein
MIGELATSKAGHDKDRLYMIVGEEGECVYLCDGRLRGVEHPKKKKKKHIQIIHSSAPFGDYAYFVIDWKNFLF